MPDRPPFDRPWASRPPADPKPPNVAERAPAAGREASQGPPAANGPRPGTGGGASDIAAALAEQLGVAAAEEPPAPATPPPPPGERMPVEPDAGLDEEELVAEAEAAISSDLSELSAERDQYLDALRRLQADFENYKKRMMKQQTTTLERAAEDIVVKLLPVLDTVDLARRHGASDDVEQVASALVEVLAKEGLERIDPAGLSFDPNEHEAVAHEEGDGEHPEVVNVLRAGYRWRGRLLRAAMVTVKG